MLGNYVWLMPAIKETRREKSHDDDVRVVSLARNRQIAVPSCLSPPFQLFLLLLRWGPLRRTVIEDSWSPRFPDFFRRDDAMSGKGAKGERMLFNIFLRESTSRFPSRNPNLPHTRARWFMHAWGRQRERARGRGRKGPSEAKRVGGTSPPCLRIV